MKKRIVHLSSVHKDYDDRIFYKECISLANYDYEVHLVLVNVKERIESNVHIHSVNTDSKSRLKRMWKTVNAVYNKGIELNGDIYHLHDPELLRIVKKLKRKGKKVIYDAHEDLPRQILGKDYIKFKKIISFFAESFENRIASKLDGVITATPFIRDRFLHVNSNTIDINNFPIITELYSEKINYIQNRNICYIGGITRDRGIVELINCLDKANATLILAGKFDDASLENEVKQLPNWSKVEYRGFLNRNEIKSLLLEVSIGMVTLYPLPNYLNSLPVKMFEYMIAGLPVICSNFPYWEKIVVDNHCGLSVDPKSANDITNCIKKLLADQSLIKQMSLNGKKLVFEKYNWDIEKVKLFKFYNSILNKS